MEILLTESKKTPKKKVFQYLLVLVSFAGLCLNILETYLNFKGSSLCQTTGCLVVHLFDVHNLLNYFGIGVFLLVFVISFLDLFNIVASPIVLIRTVVITLCIIVEGFLFGFQIWFAKAVCYFCLTVFLLIFVCFILDFLIQRQQILFLIGIAGFLAVYIGTSVVHVNLKPISLETPALIYQPGCPHCQRVMKFAEENQIKLSSYPVARVLGLIRTLGINTVPDLIYKDGNNFYILNGEREIISWLSKKYLNKRWRRKDTSTKSGAGVQNLFFYQGGGLLPSPQESKPRACELNHTCK